MSIHHIMFMGVHGCSEDLQMAGVPYFEPRDAKSSQCFIQHGAKRSGGCEAVPKSIGWTCQPGDSNIKYGLLGAVLPLI